jgi:aminopeptidase
MADERVARLARVLVDYSTDVQPGETVVIRGLPAAAPLITAVFERVLERGGYPALLLDLPGLEEIFLRRANEDQLGFVPPLARLATETFDVTLNVGGQVNTRGMSAVDPERQKRRRSAVGPIMQTFMQRSAEGTLRWALTQYPTDGYAQDADMSLREYEDFVYGACHVDDGGDPVAYWQGVKAEQDRLVSWLKGKNLLEVRGPNADLRLSVAERTFINCCGLRNMPDGEVFTGPVEQSVNGWVRFTYPVVAYGREVDGVEIHFEDGRAVKATAAKNEDFLRTTLATDPGASYLGEFAIATNFGIQRFTKNILFDEKIGGTIHMAFGNGYPETGSRNISALHWDMICDMRDGSEILVDGEVIYRNGQFLI